MPFPTLIEQILAASFAVANCDFPRPSAAGVGETFNRQNELLRNLRGGPVRRSHGQFDHTARADGPRDRGCISCSQQQEDDWYATNVNAPVRLGSLH